MEKKLKENANDEELSDVRLSEAISLIGELSKRINNKINFYYPEDDVPKGMKLVLQCLMDTDGVTQLDIVKFTGFKPPTISIMIQKMEQLGYVTRKPDTYDLRAMRVFISDEGKRIYYNAVKAVKTIECKLLKGLNKSETEAMIAAMKKISKNLEEF